MRVGESFGEACRYCGATLIIVEPASSAGHCGVCSHEAVAWATRADETVDRYAAAARFESAAAAAHALAAESAERIARRRAALWDTAAAARSTAQQWLRLPVLRARTSPQP